MVGIARAHGPLERGKVRPALLVTEAEFAVELRAARREGGEGLRDRRQPVRPFGAAAGEQVHPAFRILQTKRTRPGLG